VKGQLRLEWQNGAGDAVRAFALRDFRELGEEPERSRALNSIAGQEFGSDYTDPYEVAGFALALEHAPAGETLWRLETSLERPQPTSVLASPVARHFLGLVEVPLTRYARVALRRERPTSLSFLGTELRSAVELRALRSVDAQHDCFGAPCAIDFTTLRASFVADLQRPFATQRLILHTVAGAVGGRHDVVPPEELLYFGGPVTGPGYDFHELAGRAGISQRLEWRSPIPFFAVPLGRFGKVPASATLAPYAHVVAMAGAPVSVSRSGLPLPSVTPGAYPALGVGLLTFFDLVRFDVSRGLRHGRWLFSFDVNSDFWSVL
jgi:hypothetical protein